MEFNLGKGINMSGKPENREAVPHLEKLKLVDMTEARRLMAKHPEYKPHKTSVAQAENMARFSGVELSDAEIRLYGALRDEMSGSTKEPAAGENETVRRATDLSDQELLAAVIGESGDMSRLRKFLGAYPNIFGR
jgi:hypothetical protein